MSDQKPVPLEQIAQAFADKNDCGVVISTVHEGPDDGVDVFVGFAEVSLGDVERIAITMLRDLRGELIESASTACETCQAQLVRVEAALKALEADGGAPESHTADPVTH